MGDFDKDKADFIEAMGGSANPPAPIDPAPADPVDPAKPTDPPANPIDPAPADPVNPTDPPPAPTGDAAKIQTINETFGTSFTSLEEVETFKGVLSDLPNLQEAKIQFDELKGQSIAKFHSKNLEELNTFADQTGIEDPGFIKQVKQFDAAEKKDPIEALVLAEILKDPSLIDKKDILVKSMKREYQTQVPEDLYGEELAEAQEKAEMEQFRLDRKAAQATKEIEEVMGKVKTAGPVLTVSESIKQRQELKAQWEGVVDKNVDQIFGKIPVQVPKGKDKNGQEIMETVDFIELTPEEAKAQAKLVVNKVVSSGLALTQENLIEAVSEQYQLVLAKNLSTVLSKLAARTEGSVRLQVEKEVTNPSQLKVETPAAPRVEKTASDVILEKWDNYMKGN